MRRFGSVVIVVLCGLALATTAQERNDHAPRSRPALGVLARRGFLLESATGSAPAGMRINIVFLDDTMAVRAWCMPLVGPAALRGGKLHARGLSDDSLVGCLGADEAKAHETWFVGFLARAPRVRIRGELLTLRVRKVATLVFKERPLPAALFRRERLRQMMAPDTPWGPNPVPR